MALLDLKSCVSSKFVALFDNQPSRICVSPGRVNIVGEHIDYSGYAVLPCAIGRFTVICVGISPSSEDFALKLALASGDSDSKVLTFESVDEVCHEKHHWSNYVLASYMGLKDSGVCLPRGIQMVVGGNVPQASGLSSSSSLVVACALAMSSVRLSRQFIAPEMLAEICMRAEWYVGTAGGGMDQAAIILSQAGYASHIKFNPVSSTPVKLPDNLCFVVANSQARSAKAETAHLRYNKRVFECKVGQRILRNCLLPNTEVVDAITDTFSQIQSDLGNPGIDALVEFCKKHIPSGFLGKKEITDLIGQETVEHLLTGRWGRSVWDLNEEFAIQSRAVHVFTEASRVVEFVTAAATSQSLSPLASIMNESNRSCDEDYDCSCPELRRLVAVMRASGCLGARLTGAGWGGCAVGIVEKGTEDLVVEKIAKAFYPEGEDLSNVLFSFEPVGGAYLEELKNFASVGSSSV